MSQEVSSNDVPTEARAAEPPTAGAAPARPAVARGLRGGFYALVDQALVSIGNFALNILLARHMAPVDYGVYALLIWGIIAANTIQSGLIGYPLTVRGAVADMIGLRRLTSASLMYTLFLATVLAIGGAMAAVAAERPHLIPWIIFAMVLWQCQETARRALISHLRQKDAIWGDGVSYLGQVAIVWLLIRGHRLSLETVFFSIGITSFAGLVIQALQVGLGKVSRVQLKEWGQDFLTLGKWPVLSSFVGVAISQFIPWSVKYYHGLEQAGQLQSLWNVMGISNPITVTMVGLIIPSVAKVSATGTMQDAWRAAWRKAIPAACLLVPFYLIILVAAPLVLRIFYKADSPFLKLDMLLRLMAVGYVLENLSRVLEAYLNGLQKSRWVFISQIVNVGTAFVVGVPLVAKYGVMGAALATVIWTAARLAASAIFVFNLHRAAAAASAPAIPAETPSDMEPVAG